MPLVRFRQGGRGALGGVGLTSAESVPDELVRDACELAVFVARSFDSPREVPGPVRRYLKMQWLPAAALGPLRRVLDADDAFRARVAEAAVEDVIGRASFVFLVRAEGWDDELASLAAASSAVEPSSSSDRDERVVRRKLSAAEARLADLQVRVAEATAAEVEERAARVAAESSLASLSARVDSLRHERDDARARLARAEERIAELTATPPPTLSPPPPAFDVDGLRAAVDAANLAAQELRAALDDASRALREPESPPSRPDIPALRDPQPIARRAAPTPPPRRTPVPLPGGLRDDTVEAAEWLVRRPGVVVVVDGYNCTLRDSPLAGHPIPEQRRRLIDALTELASRTHADVEVVFDGADVAPALAAAPRRHIRVTFSPPGTEADDVVIARTRALPVDRPVVVASSDNRVRTTAAANGANVISAEQLMALVRARR